MPIPPRLPEPPPFEPLEFCVLLLASSLSSRLSFHAPSIVVRGGGSGAAGLAAAVGTG
jgi:hypothetical protein